MFRCSLTTNQWRAGLNENKEVSFCKKSSTFELVPIQRIIKFIVRPCDFAPKHFNLVPSFTGYEIAQRLFFL